MKKLSLSLLTVLIVLLLGSCFLNPYYSNTYNLEMSGAGNTSARTVRSMTATPNIISNFEKYEIEVIYVYIALFDTEAVPGMSYDMHTLYNTTTGNGTTVNLAKEKLSDKLPLSIENPLGNGIDKIYIGISSNVTAKGYVNMNGTVYRTRSNGTMTPDGATEAAEEGIFPVQGSEIPAFSADQSNPAVQSDVKGIYLWLASGGRKHAGHEDLKFNGNGSTIDLKFPLETGLVNMNGSDWTGGNLNWVTPYIDGTSLYEKYYLKKAGAAYYTDIMRVLTDANGNAVVGQLILGPVSNDNQLFNRDYGMWYNADDVVGLPDAEIDAAYAEWFSQESDNADTFYFKAEGDDALTCTSFQRQSHSGTFVINGTSIDYDCLKVE